MWNSPSSDGEVSVSVPLNILTGSRLTAQHSVTCCRVTVPSAPCCRTPRALCQRTACSPCQNGLCWAATTLPKGIIPSSNPRDGEGAREEGTLPKQEMDGCRGRLSLLYPKGFPKARSLLTARLPVLSVMNVLLLMRKQPGKLVAGPTAQ